MYQMPYFTETNQFEVLDFMRSHSFITLIGSLNGQSVATQIPIMIQGDINNLTLIGHVMRETDHCKALMSNPNVLALFTGAHCYVSAGWYAERGHASTWNYISVHARGTIKILNDRETLQVITEQTRMFEENQPKPQFVSALSEDYLQAGISAIAGFEMKVEELYPIFKLSQNRDDKSYQNIVYMLEAQEDSGSHDIALEMRKRRKQLFLDN